MSIKTCPCCGQVIPRDIALPPIKQRIYDALKERPRTSDELRDIARSYYSDREFVTWKLLYSHIYQLNKLLHPHGMRVRQPWRFEPYRLVAA